MPRISILLDAIARPVCIECNMPRLPGSSSPLCPACHRQLPWWRVVDGCPRCGTPRARPNALETDCGDSLFEGCAGCLAEGSALHSCHSLTRYEGPLRRWIPGFKNSRSPFGPAVAIRLAIDHLAVELARQVLRETAARPDLIVSIPLHPHRRRWRGFNHVDPISRRIACSLGRPWLPDGLERTQDTRDQAGRIGRERRDNVRGAFRATSRLDDATHIWLVDDVLTTGSTLDAAGDALLEAGAFEVRALTLAATLPRRRAPRCRPAYHAPPEKNRSQGSM